jgi:DNA-binding response OmpR family regulator
MKPLLILTKNLLVEQTIQARLQELGYEVFCSETFLRKLYQRLNIKEVKENFQGVILNGTITDREAESIISTLEQQIPCFRKLDRDPTEQEEENIRKIGFCGWISDSQSSDRLRESLSTQFTTLDHQKNSQVSSLLQTSEESQKKNLQVFLRKLTNREWKFFQKLMEANGAIVSRTEMCLYIWEKAPNHSYLAQLSVLVKRIKGKLKSVGIDEESLETIWGKGYRLSLENSKEEKY